jgi:putative serine protease PepD
VPPLHSGDPGDGHGEDDHDLDDVGFVPPLPPEDRLWRHPSEVAMGRATATADAPTTAPGPSGRRTATLMLLSGMVGATLAVAAVGVLGGFDERVVERQVAVRTATVLDHSPEGVGALAARTAPSVAALRVHRGDDVASGSAVVLRSDGYLLTDAHVVEDADSVEAMVHDRALGTATVVGVDTVTGVALLHLPVDDLEPATIGDSSSLEVGERTVAVGAIADGGWDAAVSSGVVSALWRRLEAPDGTTRHGMILVDTPFAPGTAGGALVDASGAVVGIASGSPAGGGGGAFGVATPIDLARHVADQLLADGRAAHVWLGLHGKDLDAGDAPGQPGGGALVADLADGGPAHRAGVEIGDVVMSVDGEPTPSMSALIARLQLHVPGDTVVLGIHRDGARHEVRVVLAAKPDDE